MFCEKEGDGRCRSCACWQPVCYSPCARLVILCRWYCECPFETQTRINQFQFRPWIRDPITSLWNQQQNVCHTFFFESGGVVQFVSVHCGFLVSADSKNLHMSYADGTIDTLVVSISDSESISKVLSLGFTYSCWLAGNCWDSFSFSILGEHPTRAHRTPYQLGKSIFSCVSSFFGMNACDIVMCCSAHFFNQDHLCINFKKELVMPIFKKCPSARRYSPSRERAPSDDDDCFYYCKK